MRRAYRISGSMCSPLGRNGIFGVKNMILDIHSGASAAYSLRKLAKESQYAIRVRRGIDDTEQDIGFIGNNLDIEALLAFVGGGDGFVRAWYDQSGSGNHATQTINNSQPKVVALGVLISNGIEFDGINDCLDCGTNIVSLSQNPASVFCVSDGNNKPIGGASAGYIMSVGDSVSPYSSNFILGSTNGLNLLWVNASTFGEPLTIGDNQLIGFDYDEISFQSYLNGAISGSSGAATVNTETSNTIIGASGDCSTAFTGRKISELIVYKSDQSSNRAHIEADINKYYSLFF